MVTYIVKDPSTGEERPMTQKSFELAGKKRGFKIVGEVEKPKSDLELAKEKLRAEKAAKQSEETSISEVKDEPVVAEEPKKRGPKPKTQA
jgi:hypothetical protein